MLHVGLPTLYCLAVQTIGVWGDIGHTPNSTDTRNHLLANNPAIVYNTADFVYAGALLCLFDVSLEMLLSEIFMHDSHWQQALMSRYLSRVLAGVNASMRESSSALSTCTASESLHTAGVQTTTRRPSRSARTTATTRPSQMQVRSLVSFRDRHQCDCALHLVSRRSAALCVYLTHMCPTYM